MGKNDDKYVRFSKHAVKKYIYLQMMCTNQQVIKINKAPR